MTPDEIASLTARLVATPQDPEALADAHREGQADPAAYADLLERVAEESPTDALAAHWQVQAAIVCVETLDDPKRAARLLRAAVERAPKNQAASDRLERLYREHGKWKALAAFLEKRGEALEALAASDPAIAPRAAAAYVASATVVRKELRRAERARDLYGRAMRLDPGSIDAIRGARTIELAAGRVAEAIGLYDRERAASSSDAVKAALYRQEAEVRLEVGDGPGATASLRFALGLDASDAGTAEALARSIAARVAAGDEVPAKERAEAASHFVALAAGGARGDALACWLGALDVEPTHARALDEATRALVEAGRHADAAARWQAALAIAPDGPAARGLREKLADAYELLGQVDDAIAALEPLAAADPVVDERVAALRAAGGDPAALVASLERKAAAVPAARRAADLLVIARLCVDRGLDAKALAVHHQVLDLDPAEPTSLAFVEARLREAKDEATLERVLARAASAPGAAAEVRRRCFAEAARLGEKHGDVGVAIGRWEAARAIDRRDATPRAELARLYERAEQWDDLVALLVTEPDGEDAASAAARLRRVAEVQERRLGDPLAAASTWRRVASLVPGDVAAMSLAAGLYERAQKPALAAEVIRAGIGAVEDAVKRAGLYVDLGRLLEAIGERLEAADAYLAAADIASSRAALEAAERCFVAARRPKLAARAVARRASLARDPKTQAALLAREASLWVDAGEIAEGLARLERAVELDPGCEPATAALEARYQADARFEELVALLLRWAERLPRDARVATRRRAAEVAERLWKDRDAAATILRQVLADGEDAAALGWLARDAEAKGALDEAAALFARLAEVAVTPEDRARAALDEARVLAGKGDVEGAEARCERVLAEIDPTSRAALEALAELAGRRGDPARLASVLDRALALETDAERARRLAARLADLAEHDLGDAPRALAALERLASLAPGDAAVLERLADLEERAGRLELAAMHLGVAASTPDRARAAAAARKLAALQAGPLGRPADALATLRGPADAGDEACRAAWVELAESAGDAAEIPARLEAWSHDAAPDARSALRRSASVRLLDLDRLADAARLVRLFAEGGGVDRDLASRLGRAALAVEDREALAAAHELAVAGLAGAARADELVRQAEELARAGVAGEAAVRHGERGLGDVARAAAEPLLARLAALCSSPDAIVDLYERQVDRATTAAERAAALGRVALVATEHGSRKRAAHALEAAIAAAADDAALAAVERAVAEGDARAGDRALRGAFAALLASSAQAGADAEPRRAALLRRAAVIAYRDLGDVDRAFRWLGDALAARLDAAMEAHATTLAARLEASFEAEARSRAAHREELARVEARLGALLDRLEPRPAPPPPRMFPDPVPPARPDPASDRAARAPRPAEARRAEPTSSSRVSRARAERPPTSARAADRAEPSPRPSQRSAPDSTARARPAPSSDRRAPAADAPVASVVASPAPDPAPRAPAPSASPGSVPAPPWTPRRPPSVPAPAAPPARSPGSIPAPASPPPAPPPPAIARPASVPAPPPDRPASSYPPPPPRTPPPPPAPIAPRAPAAARRLEGDDLIDALFDAMPGLDLCEDAFLGAEFVAELCVRKLGCSLALVHLYDINRREFVVAASAFVAAAWSIPPELRSLREGEHDPLLTEAMRSDEPIHVPEARSDPRAIARRFLHLERLPRTVLAFGVRQAGRYLGAIELADPSDGGAFGPSDANALAYVGERLADFLAARGILVDRASRPDLG
jgi:hypothetical protein